MAFTRDSIKQMGITDDETITKILNAHHAEFDPVKEKADKYEAEKERADNLKKDYDEQSKSIQELKSSTGDKDALEKKIKELEDSATTKAEEHKKAIAELESKVDNAEFEKILDTTITKFGGKRAVSIKAELKLDDLRASKNRTTDIESAIKELKDNSDTAFLFGEVEPKSTGAKVNTSGNANGNSDDNVEIAKARAVMGLDAKSENGKE